VVQAAFRFTPRLVDNGPRRPPLLRLDEDVLPGGDLRGCDVCQGIV
jgi:hypothetical protein